MVNKLSERRTIATILSEDLKLELLNCIPDLTGTLSFKLET